MKKLLCGAVLALAVIVAGRVGAGYLAPKDIETIMDEAHQPEKTSLRDKVLSGKATAEEAKKLLTLYDDLGKNKPPKGTEEAWKVKTVAIVVAAKKVAAKPDDTAALADLRKATLCGVCHKDHKP